MTENYADHAVPRTLPYLWDKIQTAETDVYEDILNHFMNHKCGCEG